VPFDDIARMLDTSAAAARQLASRARRRVRIAATPDGSLDAQREVVNAFFAAARSGDFEALISVLAPGVVLRSDGGTDQALTVRVEGAANVAGRALMFANPAARLHPVVVNGGAGVVATVDDRPFSLLAFTVVGGYIVEIDAIADPERVSRLVGGLLTGE
jgi:RNA polymerase sigma-70 factor (ECF subfamily)